MLLKLSDHPFMRHLRDRREEERRFAEENPELAQAWSEALSEHYQRQETEVERQLAAERRLEGLRMAGAPERLREVLGGRIQLRDTPARIAARQLTTSQPILLMCGSPGCGKTFAAVAQLADALEVGLVTSGLFAKAFELSKLSLFAAEDKARLSAISKTRFLILDDLGAEMLHDGLRPMLDELIDARYQSGGRTILTTNLSPDAFKARYGDRIADRIREMGRVVLCGDKSLRRGAA